MAYRTSLPMHATEFPEVSKKDRRKVKRYSRKASKGKGYTKRSRRETSKLYYKIVGL